VRIGGAHIARAAENLRPPRYALLGTTRRDENGLPDILVAFELIGDKGG